MAKGDLTTYTLPPSAGGGTITIRELGVSEVLGLQKEHLESIKDEKDIALAEASLHTALRQAAFTYRNTEKVVDAEEAFYDLGQKGTNFLNLAYKDVHEVSREEGEDFLGTRKPGGPSKKPASSEAGTTK